VDFRFIAPDLGEFDLATAEVIACCIYDDVWPMRGAAGVLDFRLAARLSRLARSAFLAGSSGELLCVPARPRLPFDKILLFGMGPRRSFGDTTFRETLGRIGKALEGLKVPRAVVELPGRGDGAVSPEHAAELLLAALPSEVHETWWLIEPPDAQRVLGERLEQGRHKRRKA
jgi:hypothetical protein